MGTSSLTWRRWTARLLGGLAISMVFPIMATAQPIALPIAEPSAAAVAPGEVPPEREEDQLPTPGAQTTEESPVQGQVLGLSECIGIALDRQPALAAQRASLASAEASRQGLEDLRAPAFIVRDIRIRRCQSALGVNVASAAVTQAERETIYAVTRNYLSVLYAREQQEVTNKVASELSDALANAERLLGKEGAPRDLTKNSVDKNKVYLHLAEAKKVEAGQGVLRAMAALREAMASGPEFCFSVAATKLPQPELKICVGDAVNLALSRRGELAQAVTAQQVTGLEIEAQGKSWRAKKETFAAASDIHANPIPQGTSDGEYRPGAVGLDMPTMLAGHRSARMERASDLHARAGAVVEKTQNLIVLEVQDAYLRWEAASKNLTTAKEGADIGDNNANNTLNDFKAGLGVPYRDVLEAVILAAQARAQYNDTRYQLDLALAALERATAGGLSAGFEGQPLARD